MNCCVQNLQGSTLARSKKQSGQTLQNWTVEESTEFLLEGGPVWECPQTVLIYFILTVCRVWSTIYPHSINRQENFPHTTDPSDTSSKHAIIFYTFYCSRQHCATPLDCEFIYELLLIFKFMAKFAYQRHKNTKTVINKTL